MTTPTITATIVAPTDEPLGIIISSGDTAEPKPRVMSYVWGPGPERPAGDTSKAA